MRILLDSRDLIELTEYGRPVTIEEFGAYLERAHHQNLLSFTNVRELVSPLATGREFMELRPLLQSLERIPHIYVKESNIFGHEIEAAVRAFETGQEYAGGCIDVNRWDDTLMLPPGQVRGGADNWVNFRLDEIVYWINRTSPGVFAPPRQHLARLQAQFNADRDALRRGGAPAREHFVGSIGRHAAHFGVRLPAGREDDFGRWVYSNPSRCPGLRLNYETYRALMANYRDIPETGDFSDLAHVSAIPYVDAATLDRRMRHYCMLAALRMVRLGGATDFGARTYENLGAVMENL